MEKLIAELPWWFWVTQVLLIPIYAILGTAKHELAHAIAARCYGLKVKHLTIIPSYVNGQFYMGYFWLDLPDGQDWRDIPNVVYMMPYYVDVICWGIGMFLTFNSDIDWYGMPLLQAGFGLAAVLGLLVLGPMIDFAWAVYKMQVQLRGDMWKVANKGGS